MKNAQRIVLPSSPLRAPLLYAACLLATGVLLEHHLWRTPGLVLLVLILLLLLVVVAVRRAPRMVWGALALLFVATGYACALLQPVPPIQGDLTRRADGLIRTVEGRVKRIQAVREENIAEADDPVELERTQQLDLEIGRAEELSDTRDDLTATQGGIRLTVLEKPGYGLPAVRCGDVLQFDARLRVPGVFHDHGVWNSREYIKDQGVDLLAFAPSSRVRVQEAGKDRFSLWACNMHAMQQAASARVLAMAKGSSILPTFLRLNQQDAGMLTAMVTGDRTYLDQELRVGFERTGTFHLLVVSGLHLAVIAGLVVGLLRRLRVPRVAATFATIVVSLAYALFSGGGLPVLRSFWMVTLYLLARLLFRQAGVLNAVGLAALCMLVVRPDSLLESSFQMTVLVVLAIGGMAVPLLEHRVTPLVRATRNLGLLTLDTHLEPAVAQWRVCLRLCARVLSPLTGRWFAWRAMPWLTGFVLRLWEMVIVALVAECLMALPVAVYFHRITVMALPANLAILPVVGFLLPCALVTLLVAVVAPSLAFLPAAPTAVILHGANAGIALLSGWFRDVRIPGPGTAQIVLCCVLAAAALAMVARERPWRRVAVALMLLYALCAVWSPALRYKPAVLEVDALDVAQGDSLLMVSPQGETMLVDAGGIGGGARASSFDIGEEVVSNALWARGVHRLNVAVLTHAHSDHMGGMEALIRNLRPSELWISSRNGESQPLNELLSLAAAEGVTVRRLQAGQQFPWSGTQVRILSPAAGYQPKTSPSNNDSLVMRVALADTSVLLSGDAEWQSETAMLAGGSVTPTTLLKVGHHGSSSSTTPQFLAAVHPQVALISAGAGNFYGHPHKQVLERLQAAGVRTFRTDSLGQICFVLDGRTMVEYPMCPSWRR